MGLPRMKPEALKIPSSKRRKIMRNSGGSEGGDAAATQPCPAGAVPLASLPSGIAWALGFLSRGNFQPEAPCRAKK